ncbi:MULTISPECIES: TlpA disulfide reductase family protein [unclassified Desulfovibrio]|uniref:TlpA family protein disulfide reductase n=1 Tax=unclassified Desulfovibrio TaxID=2593640 RepID=UPI0013EC43FD|nr:MULTISPECIES: TlpA disulfide reductase family protein [unclassified Desulfovibrio]
MKRIALAFLISLLLPCAALAAADTAIPTLDQAGLTGLLEKNKGKVVILNFFATWCPPCRVEIPELVKVREAYPESELLLVGLSVDETSAPVVPFTKKAGVNYPVYMAAQDVTDAYRVTSVPHNAFFARDGHLVISEPGMAEAHVIRELVDDLLGKK